MDLFRSLGLAVSGYYAVRVVYFLYRAFLRPGHNLLQRYSTKGMEPWAVVTGASDGIGKEFCIQLARMGFSVCLVSRTKSKLEAVADLVQEANPAVKTRIITLDFADVSFDDLVDAMHKGTDDLDVCVVVNNAGVAHEVALMETFHGDERLPGEVQGLLRVNVQSFTAVLTAVLPHMAKRDAKCGIINVSSGSALHGLAYNAAYAASKGFNNAMSMSLSQELRNRMDVISFTPLFVATNMTKAKPNAIVVTAEEACRSCLRCLGHEDQTMGALSHQIQHFGATNFPNYFEGASVGQMKKIRARIERKRASVAKKE